MTLEVFKQTVKDKWLGATIATVLLFIYVFWIGTMFNMIADNMEIYDQILKDPTMQALLGVGGASLGTFEGFMSMEVFSYMGLVVGGYLAFVTASFIAGEIEQKTSDIMLSLPVSRTKILLSRFAVVIPIIAVVYAAIFAGMCGAIMVLDLDLQLEWLMYATMFAAAMTLAMAAISLFMSALMSDGKKAALISLGIFILSFLIENVGSAVSGIDWARALSIFHYQDITEIVSTHTVNWANFGILIGIAVLFVALAVIVFNRRDINVT